MTGERGERTWYVWGMIPRLAGGVVSVPLVVGFVALGAAVIVGRSVRDIVRVSLVRRPLRNGHGDHEEGPSSDAA